MGDTLSPRGAGPDAGTAPQPPAPQPPAQGGSYLPPGAYPPPPGAYAPPQQGAYPPPPGAYAPPPTAMAVIEPPQRQIAPASPPPDDHRDRYEPDQKRPSPVWEAIKWPLRKTLLGVYIVIQGARRHKVVALVVSALLIALVATALIVRQLTLPPAPAVAIEQPARLPPIPASVMRFLHGQETYNAQEVWDSLDATARSQSGGTESQLQTQLDQERAQGIQISRFVYSGGYQSPDGSSHYTIEVYATKGGQAGVFTWYFVVGPNGLITAFTSLQ